MKKKYIKIIWWNIQVFLVRITGDGPFWDRFEVLPPNKFTWELDRKEYRRRFIIQSV